MNNSKHERLALKLRNLRKEFENRLKSQQLQITDNDIMNKRGVYFGEYSDKILSNTNFSTIQGINNAYNRHVILNIFSLVAPGSLIIQGNIYNDTAGIISSHSEEIDIISPGYIRSQAKFIGPVEIFGFNGIIGNYDVYLASILNFNNSDFTITAGELTFVPDGDTYNIQVNIFKVHADGHQSLVFMKSFSNNDTYKFGSRYLLAFWKQKGRIHFKGSQGEGFYVVISRKDNITAGTAGIRTLSFIMGIEKKAV